MSYPPRPPLVPYGMAPAVVPMPMPTHVMVGAYSGGGGRGALLPAPGKAVISRPPATRQNGKDEGPPVTVFIGNITSRVPDTLIHSLVSACGTVLSWKRVSTFGFCEFSDPEAALRCVRLLNGKTVADKQLLARMDEKMQALVDDYKTSGAGRGGAGGAADAAAAARIDAVLRTHTQHITDYEAMQKEEMISKTAKVLEEADISEEKRDVIHREIGKFRESMKSA